MNKRKILYLVLIINFILGIFIYTKTYNKNNQEEIINKTNKYNSVTDLREEDLKTKEYLEANDRENLKSRFTLNQAIEICKNKYGCEDDTIYVGNKKIEKFNEKNGYIIQVKSKQLMNQQGSGILFTVFVCEDGEIIELN